LRCILYATAVFALGSFIVSLLLINFLDQKYNFRKNDNNVPDFSSTAQQSSVLVVEPVEWPHLFIHIVNTRFQQEQGNLIALGRARLLLFETFCLPSIIGQTLLKERGYQVPPFLWIIKVDPNLVPELLSDLIAVVQPYPFIYVVASNKNYGIGQEVGGWRGGEEGTDVLSSTVYTGNMTWLKLAHDSRNSRGVLETRLDADDGFNIKYLEGVEQDASKKLLLSFNQTNLNKRRWMYWCSLYNIEWSPTLSKLSKPSEDILNGVFSIKKSPHHCITAGMTVGVALGMNENKIPRFIHDKLVEQLRYSEYQPNCGEGQTNITKCLKLIADPLMGAIRSRTVTSAGMRGVSTSQNDFQQRMATSTWKNSSIIAQILKDEFWINLEQVAAANRYFSENMFRIASDNLKGQCTKGHSCKNNSKETLQKVVNDLNASDGVKTQVL